MAHVSRYPADGSAHGALAISNQLDARFEGAVTMRSGTLRAHSDRWETEALIDGLKIVVIDSNGLSCKLRNHRTVRISGPCICGIWNHGETEAAQSFPAGALMRFTAVSFPAATLRTRFGGSFDSIRSAFAPDGTDRPGLITVPGTPAIHALCAQVATCPPTAPHRDLYLSGKALELAALSLAALTTPSGPGNDAPLRSADLEKVQNARNILIDRMQTPPSLSELALAVGTNTRRLTEDFRRVFGESIFAYLTAVRLETAHQLLSEGSLNVSSVAYRVGYSPAHLSVAFRRKYGISPKDLQP